MEFLERILYYLLTMEVADFLDIAIVAFLCYQILNLMKATSSTRLIKGVAMILFVMWLSSVLHLNTINFVLRTVVEMGVLALIILFQPEIRRILEEVGGSRFSRFLPAFGKKQQAGDIEQAIHIIAEACQDMSRDRVGALIVFERHHRLDDVLRSGTKLDAQPSVELVKNVFFVKAPMHDGAMIIREGRILGAGCMLPLSRNVNLSRDLGMRHRAGIGVSEHSDSVVVLVSEETGSISVAVGGMLKRHLTIETLKLLLFNELMPRDDEQAEGKKKFNVKDLMIWKKDSNG